MDRRRSPRIPVLLPVRLWGVDIHSLPFTQMVTVKNVSGSGAVIQGLRRHVKPGQFLEVQTIGGKSQFRVVWVGRTGGRREGEAGLQSLPSEPTILDLSVSSGARFVTAEVAAVS